jgi:hypothetical protein
MTIALTRHRSITRHIKVQAPAADGSVRKALADLNTAVLTATIDRGRTRRTELRGAVTAAILLERSVLSGTADLSVFANPSLIGSFSTPVSEMVRLRALGRVMNRLLSTASTVGTNGDWIPAMSEIIGERPGLHMDTRDVLTARFSR